MRETGSLAVLLQGLSTAVSQLPEFCRQVVAVKFFHQPKRSPSPSKQQTELRRRLMHLDGTCCPTNTSQSDRAQNSTNCFNIFAKHNSPRLEARSTFCCYVLYMTIFLWSKLLFVTTPISIRPGRLTEITSKVRTATLLVR